MERWKSVRNWEGWYEISDAGRVRSLDRMVCVTTGPRAPYVWHKKGVLLRSSPGKNGYPVVGFSRQASGTTTRYVHDLVAEAFLGPRPDGLEVCHKDGVKTNSRLANLRYGTRSSNAMDRHLHGTMNLLLGEACPSAKLTEQDVRWIRANQGVMSYRAMGRKFGVSHHTAADAAKGIWWAHVR